MCRSPLGAYQIRIAVSDGRGGISEQAFPVQVTADTEAPHVELRLSRSLALIGEHVMVIAAATDNVALASLDLMFGGVPVRLDSNGRALVGGSVAGNYVVRVLAKDASGNPTDDRLVLSAKPVDKSCGTLVAEAEAIESEIVSGEGQSEAAIE
jgi:hypothetical protein